MVERGGEGTIRKSIQEGNVEPPDIDDLLERYRDLRLSYFPHWNVTPWEKREKETAVNAFLGDLEAYLVAKDWLVEKREGDARVYKYGRNPELLLKIRNSVDYFGVHTVYLVEMKLIKERAVLPDKVLASGELVFDHLRRMA
jgi:hypothetical protein